MGNKFFILNVLFLGAITVCFGTSENNEQIRNLTTTLAGIQLSSSTVRPHFVEENVTSERTMLETQPSPILNSSVGISEGLINSSRLNFPSTILYEDVLQKLQKVRKKILASNLKNASERIVLPNDKQGQTILTPVFNASEIISWKKIENGTEPVGKSESSSAPMTLKRVISTTEEASSKEKKDGMAEGRSIENHHSSGETVNLNVKKKMRMGGTTEQTGSDKSIEESQKIMASNYLNVNEDGSDVRGSGASSLVPPIGMHQQTSQDNALRNSIKFGPTGQTDWVPVIPERSPMRPMPEALPDLSKRVSTAASNKTTNLQSIIFPTETIQPQRENNVVLTRDIETPRTTAQLRNDVEKSESNGLKFTPSAWNSSTPFRRYTTMKYKSSYLNSTVSVTTQEEKKTKPSNLSVDNSDMKIPVTGASWTLATLKGPAAAKKPVERTSNHTKPPNGIDGSFVFPPDDVKVENVTERQEHGSRNAVAESISLGDLTGRSPAKGSESEVSRSPTKLSNAWTSLKTAKDGDSMKEADVIIPGSVDMNQSSDSTPVMEVLKASTPEMETTSVDITTEDVATTRKAQQVVIFHRVVNATESPQTSSNSSQSANGDVPEALPATLATHATDNILTTAAATTTEKDALVYSNSSFVMVTAGASSATPLKSGSFEEIDSSDADIYTEVEPKPVIDLQNELKNLTTEITSGAYATTETVSKKMTPESNQITSFTPATSVTGGYVPNTVEFTDSSDVETDATLTATPAHPTTEPSTQTDADFTTSGTMPVTEPMTTATQSRTSTGKTVTRPMYPATSTKSTSSTYPSSVTPFPSYTTAYRPKDSDNKTGVSASTTPMSAFTTDEGIYYKNYIPTTVSPFDQITEENVPAYLRLTVQAASWEELCAMKEDLRSAIFRMLSGNNITSDAIHFLNLSDGNCEKKIEESRGKETNGSVNLPVNMFLMDKNGDFDKNLSEAFLTLWGRHGLDFDLPIRKVDFVTPIVNLTELSDVPIAGSVVAAIVISCVAGICVILLGILFVIMKRRQKRFNYGQRCTPVSLDAYSLDSVSIYNSVRRKGMRASKRSYGNAAFDDPEVPSHPLNFAALANFSSNKEQIYKEFNAIPQVYPKAEELPEGAETKNRYANVIPLPETRVHLTPREGDPLSDYINANYVRGHKGMEKLYIACQGPMDSTVEDFWRMIWEQQCKVILMITDLQENGIEKCADYLPPNEITDNLRLFGDYQVTLKKRDVKEKYIISNLTLKNMETNLWREVTHLWFLGWPDQGVPSKANSLIAFLIEARSQMKTQNGGKSSPAVVHCSPGTGRTGTVIACDLCIRDYEQSRTVDIPKCVFNIRKDRAGAVQTKDQYAFIYQVLNVYATKLTGGGIESI